MSASYHHKSMFLQKEMPPSQMHEYVSESESESKPSEQMIVYQNGIYAIMHVPNKYVECYL